MHCISNQIKKRVAYLARYLVILHIIIVRMRFWVCWLNCSESGLANKSLLIFSAFHLTSISSSSPSGSMCLISGYTNLRLIRSVWSKPWVEYFKTEFCTLGCLLVRSQAPLPPLYWMDHVLQQNPWAILEKFFGTPLEIHISLICVTQRHICSILSLPLLMYVENADGDVERPPKIGFNKSF